MRAVIRLLPGPADLSSAVGTQMAQAMSAFGEPPGGRIPVDASQADRELVVDGAVKSETEGTVVRFLDEAGRERALVPVSRIDTVVFED